MERRAKNHRGRVVSCRLSEREMEAVQNMTMLADCSISDLLRQALHRLTRKVRGKSGPGMVNKNSRLKR